MRMEPIIWTGEGRGSVAPAEPLLLTSSHYHPVAGHSGYCCTAQTLTRLNWQNVCEPDPVGSAKTDTYATLPRCVARVLCSRCHQTYYVAIDRETFIAALKEPVR